MSECSTDCIDCSVHASSLFAKLQDELAARMDQARQERQYRRGEVIYSSGDKAEGIYCLMSGVVKLYQQIPDGREHLVCLLGPGEAFGFTSPLEPGKAHHLSAQAIEDARVCFIPGPAFMEMTKSSAETKDAACHLMVSRLRNHEILAGRMAGRSVRQRMALTLLNLAHQFGVRAGTGTKIEVRLSREEIASMAGTVVESAVRHLTEFKEEGLIQGEGRKLIVLKPERLSEIAL